MMNFTPLFDSEHLKLTPIDIEKDAPIEAPWTVDPDYARPLSGTVQPQTVFSLKKIYAEIRKRMDEERDLIHFMLRHRSDGRLLGYLRFANLFWSHQAANIVLRIASPADFQAHAAEALQLGLVYAFQEINTYRLSVSFAEYAAADRRLFEGAGFIPELRLRESRFRQGRYWDMLTYTMLRPEWDQLKEIH